MATVTDLTFVSSEESWCDAANEGSVYHARHGESDGGNGNGIVAAPGTIEYAAHFIVRRPVFQQRDGTVRAAPFRPHGCFLSPTSPPSTLPCVPPEQATLTVPNERLRLEFYGFHVVFGEYVA
jgi:hypothetical protein